MRASMLRVGFVVTLMCAQRVRCNKATLVGNGHTWCLRRGLWAILAGCRREQPDWDLARDLPGAGR